MAHLQALNSLIAFCTPSSPGSSHPNPSGGSNHEVWIATQGERLPSCGHIIYCLTACAPAPGIFSFSDNFSLLLLTSVHKYLYFPLFALSKNVSAKFVTDTVTFVYYLLQLLVLEVELFEQCCRAGKFKSCSCFRGSSAIFFFIKRMTKHNSFSFFLKYSLYFPIFLIDRTDCLLLLLSPLVFLTHESTLLV